MIGLLQRVSEASVYADGELVGCIDQGLLVFVGIEREDTKAIAARLLERILAYRVFADDSGRMNLSVHDVAGGLLWHLSSPSSRIRERGRTPASVMRPLRSWGGSCLRKSWLRPGSTMSRWWRAGVFGADMQISLLNDGPVTFWLQVSAAD